MTQRKRRSQPGWEDRPVLWSYSVAFKKPRGKRLLWVSTDAQEEAEASRQANTFMDDRHPGEGFIEYGISKTYWRDWGGYSEPIIREEYEFGVQRAMALEYLNRARSTSLARRRAKEEGVSISEKAWESAWWVSKHSR